MLSETEVAGHKTVLLYHDQETGGESVTFLKSIFLISAKIKQHRNN